MHDEQVANRIATLAAEYVAFVDAMRGGQYTDAEEYRILSSQRTLVHGQEPTAEARGLVGQPVSLLIADSRYSDIR